MDLIIDLVRAAIMVGVIVLIIGGLAALFMIVFGIATGIDRKMNR